MRSLYKLALIGLLLLSFAPLTWSASPTYLFTAKDYLYEAWFKVETIDLLGTGRPQCAVLGRDYTGGRLSVQLLSWEERKFVSRWESPNLLAEGPVLMAAGQPLKTGQPALVILSQERLYLYTYENENIILSSQFKHTLFPLELSVADLDGDGRDELLIARVGERKANYDEIIIEVYRLSAEGLTKLGSSPYLGNLRCLTAGDLDGDGLAEVVAEAGLSTRPGVFTVLVWEGARQKLVPRHKRENLLPTLPFGMTVAAGAEDAFLYTADGWGRLTLFRLGEKGLIPVTGHFSFPHGLVAVASGDFNGDGQAEVLVAGHPNHVYLASLI